MFTVKLFRGPKNSTDVASSQVMTADVVRVDHDLIAGSGKHIILDPGQQNEYHVYVYHPDEPQCAADDWNWAVIENAAGKTTEVVRP
jgi:hypothetical protein